MDSQGESQDRDATSSLGEILLGFIPNSGKTKSNPSTRRFSWQGFKALIADTQIDDSLSKLMYIALLAALCGTGVLLLLNIEAKNVERHQYSVLLAVGFAILLVIYRWSQNRLIESTARAVEDALDKKRQRTAGNLLSMSLSDAEALGRQRLQDGLSAQYAALSQTIVPIISGVESIILLAFMFAYLVSLSVFAGAATIVVVGLTVVGYLGRSQQLEDEMQRAASSEERLRTLSTSIANGYKELRLNSALRRGFEQETRGASSAVSQGRTASAKHFADLISTGTSIAYLLAGVVVFVMPIFQQQSSGEDVSRIVVAVIFILGPISSIVQTVQQFSTAQFAVAAINDFEATVSAFAKGANSHEAEAADCQLDISSDLSINLNGVSYRHAQSEFLLKPINLELKSGHVTFITGGNGSGKTTLLRVLCGLYPRQEGNISVNGSPIPCITPQCYRDMFASVFADFHLFDKPYGLNEEQIFKFEMWTERLKIRHKLGDDITAISTDNLSTGQRKRVALARALAEQRPVLVLDEWAADQDPETRQYFYEELIPELKQAGTTLLIITHDERYFDLCDQRVHLVEGAIKEEPVS
ncbi:MAG: cyclic peptide export ABC transporter [Halieaceae bacterium]|nr:cyclic peptide export ABC transporter [Halieaceae bacterium]